MDGLGWRRLARITGQPCRLNVISQISEFQPISHLSVNFTDLGSRLLVEKYVISQLNILILSNFQPRVEHTRKDNIDLFERRLKFELTNFQLPVKSFQDRLYFNKR